MNDVSHVSLMNGVSHVSLMSGVLHASLMNDVLYVLFPLSPREFVGQNAHDLAGDREDLLQALKAPRKLEFAGGDDMQNGLVPCELTFASTLLCFVMASVVPVVHYVDICNMTVWLVKCESLL